MNRRCARVVLLVLCVLLLAQETPFGSLVFGADCTDRCEDDSAARCSLGCTDCACATHGRVMSLGGSQFVLAPVPLLEMRPVSIVRLAAPRADAIFHVPKPVA